MSKMNEITEKITDGLEKIEDGVVTGYQKIESGVVDGFNKMTDQFVGKFLTRDGETVAEAKARIAEDQKSRESAQKARIEASLEASRNAGKRR
ncbi:MAG: hypothetical protein IJ960_02750 [Oscillospiraceae bacterium]|nr:hypothetical protein [Oscillospiraceae bacterium]